MMQLFDAGPVKTRSHKRDSAIAAIRKREHRSEIRARLIQDGHVMRDPLTGRHYDPGLGVLVRAWPRTCIRCGRHWLASHIRVRNFEGNCWDCRQLQNAERRTQRASRTEHWPTCRVYFRTCSECARVFTSTIWRRTCSEECRRDRELKLDRANRGKGLWTAGTCRYCGTGIGGRRQACDDCKRKNQAVARRRLKRRRAARKRGVAHECYSLAEIALRDSERCGLCGRKVDMRKAVPHPKSPTIDHILPLAAGGDDTRANVQLAHFECNWRKSDGGQQQLRVVG